MKPYDQRVISTDVKHKTFFKYSNLFKTTVNITKNKEKTIESSQISKTIITIFWKVTIKRMVTDARFIFNFKIQQF